MAEKLLAMKREECNFLGTKTVNSTRLRHMLRIIDMYIHTNWPINNSFAIALAHVFISETLNQWKSKSAHSSLICNLMYCNFRV